MILEFVVWAYAVGFFTLLVVFVAVASYARLSGKPAAHGPAVASGSWFRRKSFILHHRNLLAPVGKHPPRAV